MLLLTITAAAAQKISDLLQGDSSLYALRVAVEGGGCSGFSYKYELVTEASPGDKIIEAAADSAAAAGSARVVVDAVSVPFLLGSSLDFVDSIIEQSFVINNPNATSACGCGVSFSI